jgi:hypothetical protein
MGVALRALSLRRDVSLVMGMNIEAMMASYEDNQLLVGDEHVVMEDEQAMKRSE